ncbi:hypothetical protein ACU635_58665 [[Actinomadura] parvosata]|uniref:hypothetical protein n=1 Tax=[Actinomadura] parvosata TaxID=1955412 RepID=UPI00406C35FF
MIDYHCTGGIAGDGVDLEARMTPQLTSGVLNVKWDMSYVGDARFGSPGYFAAGSRLSMEGVVDIDGAWEGQIRPKGGKDQEELVPGSFLTLPEGLSHGAAVTETGKVRLKPGALAIRFTPSAGEWMVNDTNKAVDYTGPWTLEHPPEPYEDHHHDVHKVSAANAVAKLTFKGTKVEYIGRREPGLGQVRVLLNGKEVTKPLVEPGKDTAGNDVTGTTTQETLWTSDTLEYKQHTLEIINVEAGKTAYLDAFKVTVGSIAEPPIHDQATCTMTNNPGSIDVTVGGTGSPSPTDDPDTDPPTDDPDDDNPNNPNPNNPDPDDDNDVDSHATVGGDFVRVVTPTSTTTATTTVTPRSTGPTATKYYRAQVANTPSGGVETGVAPDEDRPPYSLMAGGMALVMGTAGGGLLLRRRRAEHAGGAQ